MKESDLFINNNNNELRRKTKTIAYKCKQVGDIGRHIQNNRLMPSKVLCEEKGGGCGLEEEADRNSIFSPPKTIAISPHLASDLSAVMNRNLSYILPAL